MRMRALFVLLCVGWCAGRWHSGVRCELGAQCRALTGERSGCVHGVCQCEPRHHLDDNRTCVPDRGLDEPCHAPDQCYWGPEMEGKILCLDGRCRCAPLHRQDSGRTCTRYFVAEGSQFQVSSILKLVTVTLLFFNR